MNPRRLGRGGCQSLEHSMEYANLVLSAYDAEKQLVSRFITSIAI
ncbi:MAG: hypothetical protein RLZZ293_975 [Pseudomonadota bacterium]|jgi:hypothetical protein